MDGDFPAVDSLAVGWLIIKFFFYDERRLNAGKGIVFVFYSAN